MFITLRSRRIAARLTLPFVTSALVFGTPAPAPTKKSDDELILLTPFEVSGSAAGHLGATPGGAKDIRFFRTGVSRGEIPHPNTFTPEGLFSQHDLPLELGEGGEGLFRVQSAATAARFEVLPDVRYLAQLGLSSGLKAGRWKPAALNLVAVVDKSGSMSGQPLALVRASLLRALRHLREGDWLSIVLYGDQSHVHFPTTVVSRATRRTISRAIDAIASRGSTNMEAGLRLGYDVAREAKVDFEGNTRVMLFTDERPNVGDTSAAGFMAMAEAASREGIGLTTIGVGVQFGAELAATISSVRGGNLFFFPNADEMKHTFASEWDTLVTELAHDFSIRIEPAHGLRVAGVFGLPANLLRWDGDALVMDVATIFLSRRKGAIYFALAPDATGEIARREMRAGDTLADVSFSYENASDAVRIVGKSTCRLVSPADLQAGLSRGAHLVDQYLTLKKAAQLHLFANDQEAAFRLVGGLQSRLEAARDRSLAPERRLVRHIHETLAQLAGRRGGCELVIREERPETAVSDDDTGLPRRNEPKPNAERLFFHR